jgi:hypothetical protein
VLFAAVAENPVPAIITEEPTFAFAGVRLVITGGALNTDIEYVAAQLPAVVVKVITGLPAEEPVTNPVGETDADVNDEVQVPEIPVGDSVN